MMTFVSMPATEFENAIITMIVEDINKQTEKFNEVGLGEEFGGLITYRHFGNDIKHYVGYEGLVEDDGRIALYYLGFSTNLDDVYYDGVDETRIMVAVESYFNK